MFCNIVCLVLYVICFHRACESNILYKRARHIGGADCHEAVDDDAYPLLAVVTGYGAYYAFEFAFGDADLLAFLEFGDDGGGGYDVLGVGGTDDL